MHIHLSNIIITMCIYSSVSVFDLVVVYHEVCIGVSFLLVGFYIL